MKMTKNEVRKRAFMLGRTSRYSGKKGKFYFTRIGKCLGIHTIINNNFKRKQS